MSATRIGSGQVIVVPGRRLGRVRRILPEGRVGTRILHGRRASTRSECAIPPESRSLLCETWRARKTTHASHRIPTRDHADAIERKLRLAEMQQSEILVRQRVLVALAD